MSAPGAIEADGGHLVGDNESACGGCGRVTLQAKIGVSGGVSYVTCAHCLQADEDASRRGAGGGRVNYPAYISSQGWRAKREERLEIDGRRCVTCHAEASLEVHHATYERLGNEDAQRDLVTLCRECHESITATIRRRRYGRIQLSASSESVAKAGVTTRRAPTELGVTGEASEPRSTLRSRRASVGRVQQESPRRVPHREKRRR